MADVVIKLSLARKSGILAAAVSTLSRAGLRFNTHRFEAVGQGHELRLAAESESEFGDPSRVMEELSRIRGVEGVVDVEVDGRSLLRTPVEPEAEMPAAQVTVDEPLDPLPESEARLAPDPKAPAPRGSEPAPEPEPEPEQEPEREFVQEPALDATEPPAGEPVPTATAEESPDVANKAPAAAASDADGNARMRPSMVRRRRRRR